MEASVHEQQPGNLRRPSRRISPVDVRWDLIVTALVAVVAALFVLAGIGLPVLRPAFALPLVLLLPGYAVTAAVFPRRSELSAARLIMAVGLSIAIDTLAAFALSLTPLQIKPAPLALLLATITCLAVCVASWQRTRIEPSDVPGWPYSLPVFKPSGGSLAVVAAAAFVVLGLAYALVAMGKTDPYTTFAVTGPSGRMEDLPATAKVGDRLSVRLAVTNHEGEARTYRVRTSLAGSSIPESSIEIADGGSADINVSIPVTQAGANQKVELVLFVEDSSTPLRTLHFFINVTAS